MRTTTNSYFPPKITSSDGYSSESLRTSSDLGLLLDRIGDAHYVLLGEASHGTHEYYTWRSAITKRLITEKGFSFLAVEGDWPDCYKINRYIKGYKDSEAKTLDVLMQFDRWPTWMWANWEIAALVDWLKDHNTNLPLVERIGFYGLDVYSLWESMENIAAYLKKVDPDAASKAKDALECFDPYYEEGGMYARATIELSKSCREEVVDMLATIRKRVGNYDHDREAAFNAEQNALIAVNAEKYYASMVGFDEDSWNIRDRHMMETLNRLMKFHASGAKGIVWEHNTHVGDARFTDMKRRGNINIGQLAREEHGEKDVVLVGFSSYEGTVIAGSSWEATMKRMVVPPAMKGSLEEILHYESEENRLVIFKRGRSSGKFDEVLGHRAIGVVYNPAKEIWNYVPSNVSRRYDPLIYIDKTKALHPLKITPDGHKMPETFPFGV